MSSNESKTVSQIVNASGIPLLVAAMMVSGGVAVCLGAKLLLRRLGPERFPLVVSDYVWIGLWVLLAEIVCIGIGVAALCIVSRRLSRPLERLASDVDALVRHPGKAELGSNTGIAELDCLAEAFNRQQAVRMRQSNEIRNLARNVIHDLRAPITNIYNEADRLSHSLVSSDEAAASVMTASRGILGMIDTNAEISRNYSGMDDTSAEKVDLSLVVSGAAEIYAAVADEKGLRFDVSVPESPLMAEGQTAKYQRLVMNLLDNAFKFTQEGGSVAVGLSSDGNCALLSVSDTGCGIPEEQIGCIYERFYRCDGSRSVPGTGLGLSMVHSIVELYGGTIECHSSEGAGTRFDIRIPLPLDVGTANP